MKTAEGPAMEAIIRPHVEHGWMIELPRADGLSIAFSSTREGAVQVVRQHCPACNIHVLPAYDDGNRNYVDFERAAIKPRRA